MNKDNLSRNEGRISGSQKQSQKPKGSFSQTREGLLLTVVLILILGSLTLAMLDVNYRQSFADLAKIGISGFIGWMAPKNQAS
jgi:predicted CDP-diglyceride synthetase/phosphatidate cytidylyltransferase